MPCPDCAAQDPNTHCDAGVSGTGFCVCNTGYFLYNGTCYPLSDSLCVVPINPCENNGTCIPSIENGTYACECPDTFRGVNCTIPVVEVVPEPPAASSDTVVLGLTTQQLAAVGGAVGGVAAVTAVGVVAVKTGAFSWLSTLFRYTEMVSVE